MKLKLLSLELQSTLIAAIESIKPYADAKSVPIIYEPAPELTSINLVDHQSNVIVPLYDNNNCQRS